MKSFFYKFGTNILDSFRGRNALWHLLAITLTYLLVTSGFDWAYYKYFHGTPLASFMFSAALVGGLAPILIPLFLLGAGKLRKNQCMLTVGLALGQSAIVAWLVTSFYKAFTGRAHPTGLFLVPSGVPQAVLGATQDITHTFKFGLLQGGIFWGWPSSHTAVAFALAFALWRLYPKSAAIRAAALFYALYIGIGVSMTIHWFSDFVAGAIIGTVIGLVVGKAFFEKGRAGAGKASSEIN